KVLLTAPGKGVDATVVLGANTQAYKAEHEILSAASCTTSCAAPMAHVPHRAFGMEQGHLTTVHAYTNDRARFRRAVGHTASGTPALPPHRAGRKSERCRNRARRRNSKCAEGRSTSSPPPSAAP